MKGISRPEARVLPDESIVPERNLIVPPPNQFTHQLKRAQAYYFDGAQQGRQPDGEFPSGAKVLLLVFNGGAYCRVADEQGLYVELEYESLHKL